MTNVLFPGCVGLQQRVIPSYRAAFFEMLAKACSGGLCIFAGNPLPKEGIEPVDNLQIATLVHAKNMNLLDPSSSMYMCWQNGFIHWLEDWQPDVLIVEANPRYPVTRKAIAWMHRRGRAVIGWGLGAPKIHGGLAYLRKRERSSFLHSLDALIAYSSLGAEQYLQLGIPQDRVTVAMNAVDPAPTHPAPDKPVMINGKATVLFIGRLQHRKRLDLLIHACASLPQDIKPHIVVVGDGPARQQFENLAHQIYPNVEFVGAKHGIELEPFFSQADLFVLPGSGGLAIQQAMAHGLPIVVAHGDGTQNDLVRIDNGWQVPSDNLTELGNILRQALSDPTQLRRMGSASYRIVTEEINLEKMVEVFIRALNKVYRK